MRLVAVNIVLFLLNEIFKMTQTCFLENLCDILKNFWECFNAQNTPIYGLDGYPFCADGSQGHQRQQKLLILPFNKHHWYWLSFSARMPLDSIQLLLKLEVFVKYCNSMNKYLLHHCWQNSDGQISNRISSFKQTRSICSDFRIQWSMEYTEIKFYDIIIQAYITGSFIRMHLRAIKD